MTEQPSSRTPTAIDAVAERWVDTMVELSPEWAVWLGRSGGEAAYSDFSPAGEDRMADAAQAALLQLRAAEPADAVDRVTKADLTRDLELKLEKHAARLHLRDLNVIESPAQSIRDIFDLMPTGTEAAFAHVATRLAGVAGALDGYRETLLMGIEHGMTPALRQVVEVAKQARGHAAADGFFYTLVGAPEVAGVPVSDALRRDLDAGALAAATAYDAFADFLENELAPAAGTEDGVGREQYALASRGFLGATIDLDETYEWGLAELARMTDEQERIARQIAGGSIPEAIEHLDHDISRKLYGTDALREWMQDLSDRAIEELGRSHFDIPTQVRALECRIAPTQSGGIYYTGPSDDFSRPGRMWWSVPEGVTEFDTWRETTTVYHEGVPGHHLQIGIATYNKALNTWRRIAGTSGHAEGWALYAERLMDELGYLSDPGDRLGMLDGQRMRAARVVLDIGVHLGKQRPDGGGVWDADYALEFMRGNVNMDDAFIRFEVNRYLGWPGQAPAYKVGQRIWEQLRDEAEAREGSAFRISQFHRHALDLGGVGLDTLRAALAEGPVGELPSSVA